MGLHAVEGFVSYVSPMPGIRLGLANIVILICFSFFREGQVFLVTLLRLLLTGLILGTFLTPSSVSYTHIDVYKRQLQYRKRRGQNPDAHPRRGAAGPDRAGRL